VQVEPQAHFGSGLASAVFSQADAVGDHFHNGAIDRVNPALETAQEAVGFSTRSKALLDVLKMPRQQNLWVSCGSGSAPRF
jgi:hypothetical protein